MSEKIKYKYSDFMFIPLEEYNGTVNSFSCHEPFLENYLIFNSKSDSDELYTRSYFAQLKENNRVVGYFTLKTDTIDFGDINSAYPGDYCGYSGTRFPALQILCIAVDSSYVRKNVGSCMMQEIYKIVLQISKLAGLRFIVVHSLPDAVGFYKLFSFTELPMLDHEDNNIMVLDIKPLYDSAINNLKAV